MDWKNRIVGYGAKRASEFKAHPLNWREHPQRQRSALRGSLSELGWIDVVIENVQTGHLIDGHERISQALDNNDAEVPYIQVDLSEEEEAQALLSIDAISALATKNLENAKALTDRIKTENTDTLKFIEDFKRGLTQFKTEQVEAEYPITPKFMESYDYILIVCDNQIDFTNLCSTLSIQQEGSYKNKYIGMSKIITFKRFMELWRSR